MKAIKTVKRLLFWFLIFVLGVLSYSIYNDLSTYKEFSPLPIWFDDPLFEIAYGSRPKYVELYTVVKLNHVGPIEYSLGDLKKFKKMEELTVNKISNKMIEELADYTSIESLKLYIDDENLDLSPLIKMENLNTLTVRGMVTEKQLNAITQIDSLREIILEDARLEKIPKLKETSKVKYIRISESIMENLNWLKNFSQLKLIYINNIYVVDSQSYNSLAYLKQLEHVNLQNIKMDQLEFLNKLKQLLTLELANISMTDLSEIQFEDLPNLRKITFDEVIERENKEQIKEFRDRLDNTEQGK